MSTLRSHQTRSTGAKLASQRRRLILPYQQISRRSDDGTVQELYQQKAHIVRELTKQRHCSLHVRVWRGMLRPDVRITDRDALVDCCGNEVKLRLVICQYKYRDIRDLRGFQTLTKPLLMPHICFNAPGSAKDSLFGPARTILPYCA